MSGWTDVPNGQRFAAHSGKRVCHRASLTADFGKKHLAIVRSHRFVASVELYMPGCTNVPEEIVHHFHSAEPLRRSTHFRLADFKVSHFLQPALLALIRKGSFVGLSMGTKIDAHDVVGITTAGHLLLSVTKETYETLGLQGKSSSLTKDKRFLITIDLRNPKFIPGNKLFDRVTTALTERMTALFNFTCCYNTNDPAAAEQLEAIPGFDPYTPVSASTSHIPVTHLPSCIDGVFESTDYEERNDVLTDLQEAIGLISLGIDVTSGCGPEEFANTYKSPYEEEEKRQHGGVTYKMRGISDGSLVASLVPTISNYLKSEGNRGWAVLSAWGYRDAPVSWGNREHGYLTSGENDCTIYINHDGKYLVLLTASQHDTLN